MGNNIAHAAPIIFKEMLVIGGCELSLERNPIS